MNGNGQCASTAEYYDFQVLPARESEWDAAMELAFKTFMKYEGMDYGPEGIQNFSNFVTDSMLKKMFLLGEYKLFVAKRENQLIGLISLRSGNHISLLFVDENYHRRGVASALLQYLIQYMRKESAFHRVTVNAAPYGIPFYHRTGFQDMGPTTKQDGITYIPMELDF